MKNALFQLVVRSYLTNQNQTKNSKKIEKERKMEKEHSAHINFFFFTFFSLGKRGFEIQTPTLKYSSERKKERERDKEEL